MHGSLSFSAAIERFARAAQQITFAKMPVRTRAGSSPVRSLTDKERPAPPVKRRSAEETVRRGSKGTAEVIKRRARRDTTTSSDMSSDDNDDDEGDANVRSERRPRPTRPTDNVNFLRDQSSRGGRRTPARRRIGDTREDIIMNHEPLASSLSSGLAETADSASLLGADDDGFASSSLGNLRPPPLAGSQPASPKRSRNRPPGTLQALPPPRPISTVLPESVLGQAIRARKSKPKTPEELFARFSGKGSLDPLNIRIYAPFSETPDKPFDMPLQRINQDETGAKTAVTVADAIGLSLWRYHEENFKPPIERAKVDVNRWMLRIVEDGEVEYDFPPIKRASTITDFTSNNNRPVRGRSRGKSYDEFALVKATEKEYAENKRVTPKYTKLFDEFNQELTNANEPPAAAQDSETALVDTVALNSTINKPFAFASRKGSATLDRPSTPTSHSTPRTGPPKTLRIHFTSPEVQAYSAIFEVTTDTYLAEVLDLACKQWRLDKAHHILRVTGTNTGAPPDRTVEVLGSRAELDLVRRRFANAGNLGLGSSPASSSPNAPLFLNPVNTTPPSKRGTRKPGGGAAAHPLSNQQDAWNASLVGGDYKRYVVVRKQPMSFAPSHPRTLQLGDESLLILPGDIGGVAGGASDARSALLDPGAKTTPVSYSLIVGCKVSLRNPKSFRVVYFRGRDTKRYDFEAQSAAEAAEIVREIRKGMENYGPARADAD